MTTEFKRPRILEAEKSGDTLAKSLGASIRDVTVADAAAKTGLALTDTERGLQWALSEYRGHLKVTESGELVFHFPTGFTRPWVTGETLKAWASRVGKALWSVAKTGLKIWILVAIVFYTLLFLAVLLAFALSGSSKDDRDDDRGFSFGDYLAWRLVGDLLSDAVWASFHMGSMRRADEASSGRMERWNNTPKKRLYERVFQFIFGPETPPADPLETEKQVLALIRSRAGRVGVLDVMSVTGLLQEEAERVITRLLVDYEGEIEVTDDAAVFYIFKDLRKTADLSTVPSRVTMAWERPVKVPALTGDNSAGTNLTVAALNTFNLCMSGFAIAADLTVANLGHVLRGIPWERLPHGDAPLLLGWIPFLMSVGIFAAPAGRFLARTRDVAKAAWENGKRSLIQLISRDPAAMHPQERLATAFENGAGEKAPEKELDRLTLQLGGDLQVSDSGQARWRFPDHAREAKALTAARAGASEEEKTLGPVVFNSEN